VGERMSLLAFRGEISARLKLFIGVLVALLILSIWELAARTNVVAPQFLPSPTAVVKALWTMFTTQNLAWHALISTARVWAAFFLAAVLAIPIGILMSTYKVVGASLEPTIDFIRYLPVPALVPLSIIWFGV
jgi:NitT/TauT family transport system permease protein